jgi:hypothetical protein
LFTVCCHATCCFLWQWTFPLFIKRERYQCIMNLHNELWRWLYSELLPFRDYSTGLPLRAHSSWSKLSPE